MLVALNFDGNLLTIDTNGQRVVLNREEVLELLEKINAVIGGMPSKQNET